MTNEEAERFGRELQLQIFCNAGRWAARKTIMALPEADQHLIFLKWPQLVQFCLKDAWWKAQKDEVEERIEDVEQHVTKEPVAQEDKTLDSLLGNLV